MRNANEVIEAVRIGGEVTEEELRYCVRQLSIWQNQVIFPIARAATEDPPSARTKRDMQRAYESAKTGNAVPLDIRLKGSSFEPGISDEEHHRRASRSIADAAVRLVDVLKGGAKREIEP